MSQRCPPPVIFSRAARGEDADLRRFLREQPSLGQVRLRIEKEPSYFDAHQVEGARGDVLVARDEGGRLVGVGSRSEKPCWVDGAVQSVGYLGNLRIAEGFRGGRVLGAGYREMERLHRESGRTQLYLTTIMEDNEVAKRALTAERPGLPRYRDHGLVSTLVVDPRSRAPRKLDSSARPATVGDLDAIAAFLEREGPRRQFYPAYTREHLSQATGLLRGLEASDIVLSEDAGGAIRAVAALWDQRPFRQWLVDGYSRVAGLARHPYNVWARLTRRPLLPRGGSPLDYLVLALVCVCDDDPALFRAVLGPLWQRAARSKCLVVCGAHVRDPLADLLSGGPHLLFQSRLYVVHWPSDEHAYQNLSDRTPYLEIGSL